MRAQDHSLAGAGRRVAVAASVVVLLLGSCAGPAGSPGPDPSAAIERAEKALPLAELWDSRFREAVAKPVGHELLGADAFGAFVAEDPARGRHLDMAAGMGYPDVIAAGRVTYDNGAVLTTAALGGKALAETAMLVIGSLPSTEGLPNPPEVVFIARPVFEKGALVRVDFRSEKGELSLDPGTGKVELASAEHGSCAPWNCLAGAVYFWWEDNSGAMDAYWKLSGEVCSDCILFPPTQPVTCPACAVLIGAPIVASVADCSIWPCNLCVSDACFAPEYASARCVTENGVSAVKRSTTRGTCESPKTQQSECVVNAPEVEVIEQCPWGCDLLGRSCRAPTECIPALGNCPARKVAGWCSGTTATVMEQSYRCDAARDPITWETVGGLCTATSSATRSFACPYDCSNGGCLPPPTCDATACAGREDPVGLQSCIVRPDDGVSILQQEYQQHACTRVLPRVAGWPWPEGSSCTPTTMGARVIETCPGQCTTDGAACAPTCDPAACTGDTVVATRCAYDYVSYKTTGTIATQACQPAAGGGRTCGTQQHEEFKDSCLWGCNATGTDCAADTGVPDAPGGFLVGEGRTTEFMWTDNSLDELGFRIYYGGCFATPARPCELIGTVAANQVRTLLTWQRTGTDRCWEIRAFNARGESAPAWYCLPG